VTKVSSGGSSLSYSSYLGGEGGDAGLDVAVDASGLAYVSGMTRSAKFPLAGAVQSKLAGSWDGFVCRVNAAGSALLFSSYLGGADYEEALGVATNGSDKICVTGRTQSADFPTTSDAFHETDTGAYETGFVSVIDLDG
jgi:hypothetical protein